MEIATETEIVSHRSPYQILPRMEIRISKASRMPSPELTDGAPTRSSAPPSSTVEDPGSSSRRHCKSSTVAVFTATREFA
ncbi:hypothetical protein TIFTF001_018700 [Ficus carica]|uniref:Uncharacterized protein n=1 Tax=Ficus carica TaxID=3494 RepID=A0AA88AEH6_FICCA|nr:hypothetical protein TIFTF001_018700 [Ficus carica]